MNAVGWLVLVALALLAVEYLIFDERPHRACGGTGWLRSPITRAVRRCWCDGGRRRRWGRGLGRED